jgi:hypothetical protein
VMGRRREAFSVAATLRLPICRYLLARVHDDAAAADRLVGAVVIDVMLCGIGVLPPDADAEGVCAVGAGTIAGPQHELVGVAVGIQLPVDRARALELGPVLARNH